MANLPDHFIQGAEIAETGSDMLDLARGQALGLIDESISANTRRAYTADWAHFCRWCASARETHPEHQPLPASDDTLAHYLGFEMQTHPAVISRRIAAIRYWHIRAGLASPFERAKAFKSVYAGYRRRHANKPRQVQEPATEAHVKTVVDSLDLSTIIGRRNRSLLLTAFDTGLRRSELAAIDCDALRDDDQGILIDIRNSKTDQEGEGRTVGLLHREGSPYCPVAALEAWIEAAAISTGPVYRAFKRRGTTVSVTEKGLSGDTVYRLFKQLFADAGIQGVFGAHSLRSGMIDSALRAGEPIDRVSRHVGHQRLQTTARYAERGSGVYKDHVGRSLLRCDDAEDVSAE